MSDGITESRRKPSLEEDIQNDFRLLKAYTNVFSEMTMLIHGLEEKIEKLKNKENGGF